MVAGDVWHSHKLPVTTTANLAGGSLITAAGAAVANAANSVFGVIAVDTPSGDTADVSIPPCHVRVLATGTVTKGGKVEVLTASVVANINGTATSTTSAGVTDLASGYPIGKALTGGVANETVLVSLFLNDGKTG